MIKSTFTRIVRLLSKWAWQHEINVVEGMLQVQKMSMEPGRMEFEIKHNPEHRKWMALCLAEWLDTSKNYTQINFDVYPPEGVEWDYGWITVTVQKGTGKTPHQLRAEAEARVKELEQWVTELRAEVNCRIEHGAESGGHLEYVQGKIDRLMVGVS